MRNERGFTLIEAIIALIIVAISTVMLVQIYGSVSRGGAQAVNILRAVEIARDQLERLGTVYSFTSGDTDGTTTDGFHWKLKIELYGEENINEDTSAGIKLFRAQTIVWKQDKQNILARLTTLQMVKDLDK